MGAQHMILIAVTNLANFLCNKSDTKAQGDSWPSNVQKTKIYHRLPTLPVQAAILVCCYENWKNFKVEIISTNYWLRSVAFRV